MFQILDISNKCILACGLGLLVSLSGVQAESKEAVLYAFQGGNDGAFPLASLYDKAGNLYGTTFSGGGTGCGGSGCGTVFKLAPDRTETVLYVFQGNGDGGLPNGGVIEDSAGNLYGSTERGGANDLGTVFKVAANGTETVLYSFQGGADGAVPYAGLVMNRAGNLYGTTGYGGGAGCGGSGCGTVFKLASNGAETVFHRFRGGSDGAYPITGLIKDSAGNLYGTTAYGGGKGCQNGGCGTVFKVAPDRTETVLHRFKGGSDGGWVFGGVIEYKGNFYGTTLTYGASGAGTVFKLAQDGTLTALFSFGSGSNGANPRDSLIADSAGNLYGTTPAGGTPDTACGSGCGIIFKLAPNGTLVVLYAFTGGSDGQWPYAGLIKDSAGNFYGTTSQGGGTGCGGSGCGTVFKLKQ